MWAVIQEEEDEVDGNETETGNENEEVAAYVSAAGKPPYLPAVHDAVAAGRAWLGFWQGRAGSETEAGFGGHEAGRCRLTPVESHVESAWIQLLKVQYDKLPSTFAFNFNLRRYNERNVLWSSFGCDHTQMYVINTEVRVPMEQSDKISHIDTVIFRIDTVILSSSSISILSSSISILSSSVSILSS